MDRKAAECMLVELTTYFDAYQLPYFLSYGTALGAYRDNGFTPTEADIDIGFLSEDFVPRVANIARELIIKGYDIECTYTKPFTKCWAMSVRKHGIKADLVSVIPFVDQIHSGQRLRIEPAASQPGAFGLYPAELVENHKYIHIFGTQMRVPFRIVQYLTLIYEDWKTPRHDHTHHHVHPNFQATRAVPEDLLELQCS